MNTKQVFAVALAVIGASAVAGEATQAPVQLTRAEVQAEFLRAQAAGELQSASDLYRGIGVFGPLPSTLTRADVQSEFGRARAAGEVPSASDSYGGAGEWTAAIHKPVPADIGRSRDAVREEARAAARMPQYNPLDAGS